LWSKIHRTHEGAPEEMHDSISTKQSAISSSHGRSELPNDCYFSLLCFNEGVVGAYFTDTMIITLVCSFVT
jgi:hypothetical protein